MAYNIHEVAIELEELDCVLRVETGDGRIEVVFDLNESGYGDFNEELNPEHYEEVLSVIQGTMFEEETPQGSEYVESYPRDNELRLNLVV